jgi:hypothetical protein
MSFASADSSLLPDEWWWRFQLLAMIDCSMNAEKEKVFIRIYKIGLQPNLK